MSSVELSPGLVVDTERGEAYVMSPDGGIVAVGLEGGDQRWHSTDADKPLATSGDRLVAQSAAPGPQNELRIVTLQADDVSAPVTESLVPLPPGIQPTIDQTASGSFEAKARPLDDDVALSWEYVDTSMQGADFEEFEILPEEEAEIPVVPEFGMPHDPVAQAQPESQRVTKGSVRLSASDGTVTPLVEPHAMGAPRSASTAPDAPALSPPPANALAAIPEPQYLSSDGRHVLSSERIADDSVWDNYRWSLYDRTTGDLLGGFAMHSSYAPFVVSGNTVIVESQPYLLADGNDVIDEPLQVRSYSLETEALVWQQPIRSTIDTTPPPP